MTLLSSILTISLFNHPLKNSIFITCNLSFDVCNSISGIANSRNMRLQPLLLNIWDTSLQTDKLQSIPIKCVGSVSQFLVEQVVLRMSQCLFFIVFSLCHLHPYSPRCHPNPLPDLLLPLASRSPCGASALVFFFLYLGGKFFCRSLAAISSMLALLQPLCRGDYFLPPRPARGTGALAHLSVPFRTGTISCT